MSELPQDHAAPATPIKRFGLWLGPLLFAAILLGPKPEALAPEAHRTLAVLAWVAVWWLTEPVHCAVAALLPFVLLPICGVISAKEAARGYQEDAIFLFLGGFLLALSLESSGVHRRMAEALLRLFGRKPRAVVFGFGVTAIFVSMWLSNAATTLLMLPAALALGDETKKRATDAAGAARFSAALCLTVAICSTLGGLATPVGTVPNMILVRHARAAGLGDAVTFAAWAKTALPLTLVLFAAHYLLLTYVTCRYPKNLEIPPEENGGRRSPWSAAEKWTGAIFGAVVLLWLFRRDLSLGGLVIPGWTGLAVGAGLLPSAVVERDLLGDGVTAIAAAVLLFVVRPKRGGPALLDWTTIERRVPWGVLFLLGSSFVLADAFEIPKKGTAAGASLATWIAQALEGAVALPAFLRMFVLSLGASLISEVGSNTAVAALFVPIGFAAAAATGQAPMDFGFAVAFGASCSFGLPVSTPPNTLVYGTGRVPLSMMIGHGLLLDLISAPVIALILSR